MIHKSTSPKYEPSSELLHISEQQLFPGHAWTVLDTRAAVSGTRMAVSSKYEYLVPDREVARGVDAHPSVIPLPGVITVIRASSDDCDDPPYEALGQLGQDEPALG